MMPSTLYRWIYVLSGFLILRSHAQMNPDSVPFMMKTVIKKQIELLSKFEESTQSIKAIETKVEELLRKEEESKQEIDTLKQDMSALQIALTSVLQTEKVVQNTTAATQMIMQEILDNEEGKRNSSKAEIKAKDCRDLLEAGVTWNGVYKIFPNGTDQGIEVYCDQIKEGGGWTVILRRHRQDPQVDFERSFEEYASGFGDPKGELWIGNRVLHSLTNNTLYTLRVEAKDLECESREATWGTFSVGHEDTQFVLRIGNYYWCSSLGDGLSKVDSRFRSNGMKFWAKDKVDPEECAQKYSGGWWFDKCYGCIPTAPLGDRNKKTFANWWFWENYGGGGGATALSEITFMIRPS